MLMRKCRLAIIPIYPYSSILPPDSLIGISRVIQKKRESHTWCSFRSQDISIAHPSETSNAELHAVWLVRPWYARVNVLAGSYHTLKAPIVAMFWLGFEFDKFWEPRTSVINAFYISVAPADSPISDSATICNRKISKKILICKFLGCKFTTDLTQNRTQNRKRYDYTRYNGECRASEMNARRLLVIGDLVLVFVEG